jgi:hypothetical protein
MRARDFELLLTFKSNRIGWRKKLMVENRRGSHTVTRLSAHQVRVTKYRYHVLKGEVQKRCRELKWKPWENSSGPRSEAGKKTSSHNALRHGLRSFEYRQYRAAMTKANRLCDEVLSNLGFVEF